MRLQTILLLILTLAGFALRLSYAVTTHPFFDEYTTVLAARQILRQGWPILPSGLFYEHGLLATYLIAPFTALYIDTPPAQWQSAQWGLMLSRWPNVLLGTATIPLIYGVGQRGFGLPGQRSNTNAASCLLAAGLFAISPEGMVWGGRARMYALATLLVLLVIYWAYRGAHYPAPAKYRWRALLALLATLLTQFGAMTLIPPLLAAMLVISWLSWRQGGQRPGLSFHPSSGTQAAQVWFLRPAILVEGAALVAIIGLAIFIKRLGRPLGVAALGSDPAEGGNFLVNLFNTTVAYQTAFYITWTDTLKFLSRQFGVPHHFWLALAALVGGLIGLAFWLAGKYSGEKSDTSPALRSLSDSRPAAAGSNSNRFSRFNLFLWLTFGLIILLMVTLLDPFRRNPRYLVMYLPLFYLLAARAMFNFRLALPSRLRLFPASAQRFAPLTAVGLLILLAVIGYNDLRVALLTPEPAYEQAFAKVWAEWQPGDTLLTMNTPAAGLYLGQAAGFTVQVDADQFLLEDGPRPVDRWLGVPWIGQAADLNAALNAGERTWFVIDTIRQPVYFRGNWLAVISSQMEQVWASDNALIYRTRPDRVPIPTQPDTRVEATLGQAIQLLGYTLQLPGSQAQISNSGAGTPMLQITHNVEAGPGDSELRLTLFWQALKPISVDYTTFLHVRDQAGVTVAQRDSQPLDGIYPTSHWQPGEIVIDPITLSLPADLPAGNYRLFTGLYRLDTLERLPVANDSSGQNAILLGEIVLP